MTTERESASGSAGLDTGHWQDRLDALAAKHGIVGATLAIRHGGDSAEAATGVLNLRTGVDATTDSVFQIGSITKVWTATLAMQLVDEGLLDLDEPIVRHLPGFTVADPTVASSVTTRQLLTHTSGIDGDLILDTGRGDDNLEKYVAAMATLTQVHPQGATMSYCNSGYVLLGRLVEVLRNASWDAVLRERLLVPLGLRTAGTLPEEALLHAAATGHLVPPGADAPIVTPQWGIFRSAGPAGLLHMTARDLLTFVQAHLDGGSTADGTRILSAQSVAAMQQPQVEVPDRYTLGSHWGLGWIVMSWDGRTVLGHDGGTLGQAAFLRSLPDAGLSVALLTNGGAHLRELSDALFDEVFSELAGVAVPARPEPRADRVVAHPERFVGRYVREGVELTVRPAGDGGLEMALRNTGPLSDGQAGPPPMTLLPYDDDVLLARGDSDGSWAAATFFDLEDTRYVHFGARATPRVSTQV
jgi:CubicO group peptidase (beta-lactamase class C family)